MFRFYCRARFELHHTDAHTLRADRHCHTPRGAVDLPTFMPVGTLGTVKGLDVERVRRDRCADYLRPTPITLALRPR